MSGAIPRDIDLLVVGGGTSGAALAGIIARDTDLRVVVLEAGPDYGAFSDGQWPRDVLDATTICRSHQWAYAGMAHSTHTTVTGYDRARVIGGCSSHNGCVALIGHRADYDGWAALGNTDWEWNAIAPAVERAKLAMRVRIPEDDEITPWQRLFIESAVAWGIPRSHDMNDPDEDQGVDASPANIYERMRWNSALAYLDPVRHRANLTVVGDALVDRVVIEGGRAVAVDVIRNGQRERVHAGRIVLSAGAYESPAILLRSGIGPAEHLREVGVEVVHELPGVGSNLTDHPGIDLLMDPSPEMARRMDAFAAERWLPDEQTLAKVRSHHCAEAFDLHLYAVTTRSQATGEWSYRICIADVEPWGAGAVRLASAKPTDHPLIDHGFLADPEGHDLDVLVDGLEIANEIVGQAPIAEVFGPGPAGLSRADLADYARSTVGIYYHPACSCRMGPASDPESVVGPSAKVHGLEGLYICDASIFPRIMRANTCLPAVTIAEHLAEKIAAG
jgi:choline dehydrogenase